MTLLQFRVAYATRVCKRRPVPSLFRRFLHPDVAYATSGCKSGGRPRTQLPCRDGSRPDDLHRVPVGAGGLQWEFLGTGFSELGTPCEARCVPCSCREGATGESQYGVGTPGTNPHDVLDALKGPRNRVHWSPFAPLGRDVMRWGDPGFRSAPPRAVAVRRVAARAGAGCMSGGCVPKGTTADFRCQSPAVTTLNQDMTDLGTGNSLSEGRVPSPGGADQDGL